MVAEKFQIYSVKITGKYICESKKLNLFIFTHTPSKPPYPPPMFLSLFPRQKEITHSSRTAFSEDLFFHSKKGKGENYAVEKNTKIKPKRVLVTSFDKFHDLCNLYIFGLCFVVP